jgi:hypothetical protein
MGHPAESKLPAGWGCPRLPEQPPIRLPDLIDKRLLEPMLLERFLVGLT